MGSDGRQQPVNRSRRAFVRGAILAAGASGGRLEAQGKEELIVRERDPLNLEMPFSSLRSFITPNRLFYVRNHFPEPEIDARHWRLSVEGAVEKPFEIGLDELLRMPDRTETVLLECAGNNRALLDPPVKGVQWRLGAVGAARWTGVALGALLERARPRSGALEVVLEGADSGKAGDLPGDIPFSRSLPLKKAVRGGVLLAHQMNGQPLPASHGFPLRAVVPDWYGMASVKWLKRIIVVEKPFHGYFQTVDYAIWRPAAGGPTLTPISRLELKAQVARPSEGEIIPAGMPYSITGAAWTGDGSVAAVEVSTDGGRNWNRARFTSEQAPHAWRLWEYRWTAPRSTGRQVILARAIDNQGRKQPAERDRNRRNYMVSHLLPVRVEIR